MLRCLLNLNHLGEKTIPAQSSMSTETERNFNDNETVPSATSSDVKTNAKSCDKQ